MIWSQNLAGLDTLTTWTFSKDAATGTFHLTPDQSALAVQSVEVKNLNIFAITPDHSTLAVPSDVVKERSEINPDQEAQATDGSDRKRLGS
jgi:hypothetical protein